MSKFSFSVRSIDSRQEGEIGVLGFPPAHYECVGEATSGYPLWMPTGRLAA